MKKELDTRYVHFKIEDGILEVLFKKGLNINLEIAKEIVANRKKFTEGMSYPGIIVDGGVMTLDIHAREYFSSEEGIEGIKAGALYSDADYGIFVGEFFIRAQPPSMPAMTFKDKEEAIKWLQQYK